MDEHELADDEQQAQKAEAHRARKRRATEEEPLAPVSPAGPASLDMRDWPIGDGRAEEIWAKEQWAMEEQLLEATKAVKAAPAEAPRQPAKNPEALARGMEAAGGTSGEECGSAADAERQLALGPAAVVGMAWGILVWLLLSELHGPVASPPGDGAGGALLEFPVVVAVLCVVAPGILCAWRPSCARGILRGMALGLGAAAVGCFGLWLVDKGLGRLETVYWLGMVAGFGGVGGVMTLAGL